MTYLELAVKILKMDKELVNSDVTIFVQDEFYAAELLFTDDTEDRLDPNHPYLKIKDSE